MNKNLKPIFLDSYGHFIAREYLVSTLFSRALTESTRLSLGSPHLKGNWLYAATHSIRPDMASLNTHKTSIGIDSWDNDSIIAQWEPLGLYKNWISSDDESRDAEYMLNDDTSLALVRTFREY